MTRVEKPKARHFAFENVRGCGTAKRETVETTSEIGAVTCLRCKETLLADMIPLFLELYATVLGLKQTTDAARTREAARVAYALAHQPTLSISEMAVRLVEQKQEALDAASNMATAVLDALTDVEQLAKDSRGT